jgi:hypothetical protein
MRTLSALIGIINSIEKFQHNCGTANHLENARWLLGCGSIVGALVLDDTILEQLDCSLGGTYTKKSGTSTMMNWWSSTPPMAIAMCIWLAALANE